MNADLLARLEPWLPVLAAAAVGLLIGWLLRGRRGPSQSDAPEVRFQRPAAEGEAASAHPKLGEPTPFPAHAPAATAEPSDAITDVVPGVAAKPEATAAFAQFESQLREWQSYATNEAVRTADQPSIDDWDDLMDIDGIDLDLARFLYAEGVHTFDQIAAMTPEQLRAVLDRAGTAYAHVDPSAWPEAARRAAMAR